MGVHGQSGVSGLEPGGRFCRRVLSIYPDTKIHSIFEQIHNFRFSYLKLPLEYAIISKIMQPPVFFGGKRED